jgi:hypothetical protein
MYHTYYECILDNVDIDFAEENPCKLEFHFKIPQWMVHQKRGPDFGFISSVLIKKVDNMHNTEKQQAESMANINSVYYLVSKPYTKAHNECIYSHLNQLYKYSKYPHCGGSSL